MFEKKNVCFHEKNRYFVKLRFFGRWRKISCSNSDLLGNVDERGDRQASERANRCNDELNRRIRLEKLEAERADRQGSFRVVVHASKDGEQLDFDLDRVAEPLHHLADLARYVRRERPATNVEKGSEPCHSHTLKKGRWWFSGFRELRDN
jgi:hypothetical protein